MKRFTNLRRHKAEVAAGRAREALRAEGRRIELVLEWMVYPRGLSRSKIEVAREMAYKLRRGLIYWIVSKG